MSAANEETGMETELSLAQRWLDEIMAALARMPDDQHRMSLLRITVTVAVKAAADTIGDRDTASMLEFLAADLRAGKRLQ